MIFLDFIKVFDIIDYDVMLNKFLDFGFLDIVFVWFRVYFFNRMQSVCVNGVFFDL